MRRALHFAFVILLALCAAGLVGSRAATPTGKIKFTGWIIGPDTPFVPGSIVTVHGTVIARSATCVEARVDMPEPPQGGLLWLCSRNAQGSRPLPGVGEPIRARARIASIKTTADGEVPVSDSFVLLRAD